MILNFTKMHGTGNDFILINGEEVEGLGIEDLAKDMCDRHFGIGADGLIVVNPKNIALDGADVSWRIINSDGSEPEMCGNGIRCFAKYVKEKGLVSSNIFKVKTLAGNIVPEILENGEIRVNMGAPILEPEDIPFKLPVQSNNTDNPLLVFQSGQKLSLSQSEVLKKLKQKIFLNGMNFIFTAVGMGNPHCVIFSHEDNIKIAKTYGEAIEHHELFPNKTNVEFVRELAPNEIEVEVWERGCGRTLACGTGACASVVAGVLNGFLMNKVLVHLPGGDLQIKWDNSNLNNPVYMTGGADFVFDGKYYL